MRAWPLLLCLAGCTDFRPGTLVESLRVLDIKSEPAEVANGQTAVLTPLVVNLTPGGSDAGVITYDWSLCNLVPAPGSDLDDRCFDADMGDFLVPLPTNPDGTASFVMPNHTLTDLGTPDSTGGLYVPVRLRVTSGGTTVSSFLKVRWANGLQPPNHNPMMADLAYIPTASNGELPDLGQVVDPQSLPDDTMAPLELPQGGKLRFRPTAAPGSAEMYTTIYVDPTNPSNPTTEQVTELISFNWYSSAGSFNNPVTGQVEPDTVLDTTKKYLESIEPDGGARAGIVDLWVIGQDERGGSDWIHRRVHLSD
jgi:hypothetical protein